MTDSRLGGQQNPAYGDAAFFLGLNKICRKYEADDFSDRRNGLYRQPHHGRTPAGRLRCGRCRQPEQLQGGGARRHRTDHGHPSGIRAGGPARLCRHRSRVQEISCHHGHHPLRCQQGGGRERAEALALLSQQCGVARQSAGTHAPLQREGLHLLVELHGLWAAAARKSARHRGGTPPEGHVALRQHEGNQRADHRRLHPQRCTGQEHCAALFQSHRGSSLGPHRRTAQRGAEQSHPLCHANGNGHTRTADHLRQRLQHARRHVHTRLHLRG